MIILSEIVFCSTVVNPGLQVRFSTGYISIVFKDPYFKYIAEI